jgi:hypothetical protein
MSAKFVSQQKTDNTFVQPISPNFIWSAELHLFKEDFAAENRISESSAAAPSTEISVPAIVFELKCLSLLCISMEHNALFALFLMHTAKWNGQCQLNLYPNKKLITHLYSPYLQILFGLKNHLKYSGLHCAP